MSQYFPKPYEAFSGDINVKVDLSNYATKTDIKNISHVDTSSFALKTNLANLKNAVDKLDIDRLKPLYSPSKLSNLVTNKVVKKTNYNTKITEIENKIPDVSNLATKTALTSVKNNVPDVSGLATKTTLTNLSNIVPDINTLIKKSDYDTKIREIENKYVSNTGFDSKLAQVNVITKINFDAKIIELEKNIKKLQTFDSSHFKGKNYFDEDGTKNLLVILPIFRYFKANVITIVTNYVLSWKSKGLSDETSKPPSTSDNSLTPSINYINNNDKIRVKLTGSCLKQSNKPTYTHGKVVNIYIVYELGASSSSNSDPTLTNCLFGAVTLTKNADIEKYKYSGYGIGFDRRSSFSFPGGGFGQNVLILGVDMSSTVHIDNKGKDLLVLGKGPTQGLESTLTAKKMRSINFTVTKQKFCLILHYNGANSYLFVNGTEIYKFKAKDSEIIASPLCLGNI